MVVPDGASMGMSGVIATVVPALGAELTKEAIKYAGGAVYWST